MLNWLRSRFERKVLDTSTAWALIDFGRATASGVHTSPEVVWRCPIVRGAIAILSESIAQLPLLVYEVGVDGSKTRATQLPLFELLHTQPNDLTSSYEFRRDLQVDVLLHGHGFAHLGRSRATGQIVELIRIPPTAVTLDENDAGEPLYFVTDKQGTRRQIDRGDILHITATGRRSPVDDCREAVGLAIAMERHQAQLYGNGARPGGILKLPGRIPPATLERLQQDFAAKWGGLAGSGKTLILEDNASYEGLTFSSTDLQHLELRRFQVSEIARAFRLPPHMLADLERTTHNNAEEMGAQFLQLSLMPHIVNWEQAMRRALLSPEERGRYVNRVLGRRDRPGGAGGPLRGLRKGHGRCCLDVAKRGARPREPAAGRGRRRAAHAAEHRARRRGGGSGGTSLMDRLDLEVKYSVDSDAGLFEGLASVFGQPDLVGDIVAPGAFRRTLQEYKAAGRMPPMLWGHDRNEPIGRWTDIRETPEGLRVKGQLTLDVQRAREARALLLDGAISGLSFGFNTKVAERRGNGRLVKDVDLYELSLVTIPCAPSARVHSVKSQPRREPAHPPKDHPMTINISAPDTPDEETPYELPPEVKDQLAALETKVGTVDQLAGRLDKIETRLARPNARVESKDDRQELERKAFDSFLRRGRDRMTVEEIKALNTADDSAVVPETFIAELLRLLVETSPMRSVARVMQVSGSPVLLPKRTGKLTAAIVAEGDDASTTEPSYGQQSVPTYEARCFVDISNALLEDSAFNLSSELAFDFAEEFGRLEGDLFVNGTGTGQPEGFIASNDFVTIDGTADLADDLIDLYHAVPSFYARRGTWLMNRATMGEVRKVKTSGTGVYLWADSLAPDNPPTLLGRPILEMPDMANMGNSPAGVAIAFGDWAQGFRVMDRIGLTVLRDPYSMAIKSQTRFHARRRFGGALVKGEAVQGLVR